MDWNILETIKRKIMGNYLGSIFRHLMTTIGGLLLGIGLPSVLVTQFVDVNTAVLVAIVPWLVGMLLSLVKAKNENK